jgi:hypothetical protein
VEGEAISLFFKKKNMKSHLISLLFIVLCFPAFSQIASLNYGGNMVIDRGIRKEPDLQFGVSSFISYRQNIFDIEEDEFSWGLSAKFGYFSYYDLTRRTAIRQLPFMVGLYFSDESSYFLGAEIGVPIGRGGIVYGANMHIVLWEDIIPNINLDFGLCAGAFTEGWDFYLTPSFGISKKF